MKEQDLKLRLRIRKLLRIDLAKDNSALDAVHETDMLRIQELINDNKNLKKEIRVLTDENIKLVSIIRNTKDVKAI